MVAKSTLALLITQIEYEHFPKGDAEQMKLRRTFRKNRLEQLNSFSEECLREELLKTLVRDQDPKWRLYRVSGFNSAPFGYHAFDFSKWRP